MNFADVLSQHRVPFETEGRYSRPGWVQFKCPFCYGGRDANKLYAGFNIAHGYVNCWRCGFHGVAKTLVALTSMTWLEATALVGELDTLRARDERTRGRLVVPRGVGPLLTAHKRYLRRRGFSPRELVKLWGIRGIGIASSLEWRIFIPIYWRGRVVSWTTRSLTDEEPRYVSAAPDQEDENHRDLLYGEDYARNAIIVHEGPLDVWRTGPGATATLGTQVTRAQLLKISRYPRRIICFDNEPAAQRRANKLVKELAVFRGETSNVVLDAKDAGESDDATIGELREILL